MSASITTLAQLNTHMLTRSYIVGYSISGEDASVFSKLGAAALSGSSSAPHAYRWALHISALQGSTIKSTAKAAAPAKAAAASDDFDDMFGNFIHFYFLNCVFIFLFVAILKVKRLVLLKSLMKMARTLRRLPQPGPDANAWKMLLL